MDHSKPKISCDEALNLTYWQERVCCLATSLHLQILSEFPQKAFLGGCTAKFVPKSWLTNTVPVGFIGLLTHSIAFMWLENFYQRRWVIRMFIYKLLFSSSNVFGFGKPYDFGFKLSSHCYNQMIYLR